MSSQEDCYFFFNSTCTKGDDCAFRHERAALGNSVLCEQWKNGTCGRNPCHLRHGIQENNQMPKSTIPCFYETQPSGCLNYHCQFLHRKPRPFLVDYQLNHAVQPSGNLRPAMPQPRLNIPFQQRFVPPHMQQFGLPGRPHVDFSPRKIQSLPPRFPATTDIRHALFTNPPRELVPGLNFRDMRPRLFDERGLGSMNGPVLGNQQQTFEPMLHHNVMKNPPLRVPMASDQQKLALDDRKMSNVSQPGKLNDGQGLLGEPPLLPFPFGGVFPFNIIPPVNKMVAERSKSRSSGKDSSKPRTVKKLDSKSRHRKSFKTVKRRVERRSSQDAVDVKKERKEKRSFTKDIKAKDTSGRQRKVKKDRISSKKSKRERRPVDMISTVKDDDKDAKKGDKEMADGANLPFKVKSLEEILRDKALKKLRERQQMREALIEGDKNAKTQNSLEKEDLNTELGLATNVRNATDMKDDSASQPQPRKVPTLKTKKKGNDKTLIAAKSKDVVVPGVINVGEDLTSGVDGGKSTDSGNSAGSNKTSSADDNAQSDGKLLQDKLSTVKVKTLDEIKRSKLKRLDLAHAKSALKPKTGDLNKSSKDCKLKPLKPLKNNARRKSLGTSGSNHGSSGNSSTQTSDDDKKEPLPAITRTPKVQEKTIHNKTMAAKLLKRKLASQLPNNQPVPVSKIQKLITNSETEPMGSAVEDTVNKRETKKQNTPPKESNISPLETVKKNNLTMSKVRKRKLGSSNPNEKTQNKNFTPNTSSNNLVHSTSIRNYQIGATDTHSSVEKNDVGLESSLNQEPVEEVNSKKRTETAKPVKKIKLKRMGFNGAKTGNENEGKSSGLGRKIRVNRKKPVEIKEDAVQLDQESMNVVTSYLRRNKEEEGNESLPMATSQTATNNSAMTLQIFSNADKALHISTNTTTVTQMSPVVARTPQISTSIPLAAQISTNITKDTQMSTSIARNPQKSTSIHTVTQISTDTTTSTQMSTNITRTPQTSTSMPMAVQISTNTPRNPWISRNTTISTQMPTNVTRTSQISATATTATHVSYVVPSAPQVSTNTPINTHVSTKTTTGSEVNKSLATSTWMSFAAKTVNIAANISDTSPISPNTVNINHEPIDFQRKSSLVLDRLVKEVSDDVRDEGDVLLDEALEKAIAEMSPVPTDDEDEISNADDLLLEIEEMINS